jgi:tetratricopeptide (TPR) repeat protein
VDARTRVRAAVGLAAVAAAGITVGAVKLTAHGVASAAPATTQAAPKPRPGRPPLVLDLGLRDDAEAQSLRRGDALLQKGKAGQAEAVFERYRSLQARMGAAYAAWRGPGSLPRVRALAGTNPSSSFARLHLGLALIWAGRSAEGKQELRSAETTQPDTASAVHASDLLHPNTPAGLPFFVPSFGTPPAIARLRPPARQYAALERAARRPDAHAKILWGVALQRLGRPVSAEREFAAAARLAPDDPEALAAAAVGRFTKEQPARAFSRLGPLSQRFPQAATVRFHLGLLLIWIGDLKDAKIQLRRAAATAHGSSLGMQAKFLLARL